mmetsp:Transcript_93760/g.235419  ORF Transcript_93760/g.235419 Transcript_93760/m.235419 type:complete len:246 (+) Transcript_93760:1481-2218(+)
MIPESVILFWIQDLQERGGWIPAVVAPKLVNLINQHNRIRRLRDLEALYQLARHCPHVSTPVTAQLCNIMHAPDGEAVELPVQCSSDALADGSLADAWGSHQAHDLALHRLLQEADGNVLQDPLLDVLQAIMVLVEDVLRLLDFLVLRVHLAPRQACEPLQVRPANVELGGRRLERAKLRELGVDDFAGLLGQGLVLDCILELRDQGLLVVLLNSELLLDLFHLLHEHKTLLLLGHVLLNLALDL